jgi:hypothetical protein
VWARAARPPPTTTRPKRLDERDEHEVLARAAVTCCEMARRFSALGF